MATTENIRYSLGTIVSPVPISQVDIEGPVGMVICVRVAFRDGTRVTFSVDDKSLCASSLEGGCILFWCSVLPWLRNVARLAGVTRLLVSDVTPETQSMWIRIKNECRIDDWIPYHDEAADETVEIRCMPEEIGYCSTGLAGALV